VLGIFDSGVGGLSVWREVVRAVPGVPLVYLADQAHVPYGLRTLDEVRRLTVACARWLITPHQCRLIVIACNTASGAALEAVRAAFPGTPIVGMEPAVKPAVLTTKTGVVGVLATPATFKSSRYADLIRNWASGVQVIEQPCAGWVDAVEMRDALSSTHLVSLVSAALTPLLASGADTLVLGCTHFPFLRPQIEQIIRVWRAKQIDAPPVTIIDPAPAVAQQVARVWRSQGHPSPPTEIPEPAPRFYTTGDAGRFEALACTLIGSELQNTSGRSAFEAASFIAGETRAPTH